MLKIRFNIYNIMLIFIMAVIGIAALLMSQLNKETSLIEKLSQGFVSARAIKIAMELDSSEKLEKVLSIVLDIKDSDCSLIVNEEADQANQYIKTSAILIKGQVEDPPMLSGRFLNSADSEQKRAVAVIGRNAQESVIQINGKGYIQRYGHNYEIIGLMGYKTASPIDDMVFINMSYMIQFPSKIYPYIIIDANRSFERLSKSISSLFNSHGISYRIIKSEKSTYLSIFAASIKNSLLYLMVIVSMIFCSVSITNEWIIRKQKVFSVKKLIGIPLIRIMIDLLVEYAVISLIGYIAGVMLFFLFVGSPHASILIQSTLITFLSGILVLVPAIRKASKIPVSEALKC